MGDGRYYEDAPRFRRRDPLKTWSIVFLVISGVALVWVLVLFWLMATQRVEGPLDTALGLSQTTWVIIATGVLFVSLVGLVFVVVARVNRSRGEGYLDATAREDDARPPLARVTRTAARGSVPPAEAPAAEAEAGGSAIQVAALRTAARVESASGPDGRMLLSYTIPVEQPRGLYADTYVPIDADAVLNVKTLLAKTPGAR